MEILTKEEFGKLSLKEQIDYYNKNMTLGKTAALISREIGINESTSRKKFAKKGYHLNKEKNKYVLNDDKSMTSKNTINRAVNDKCNTTLIKSKEILKDVNDDDNSDTLVINNELKRNLLSLAENYSEFKTMLEWFKNRDDNDNTGVIEIIQGINIDLPESEDKRTTIRINKSIWDDFDKFCNDYCHYNKQDLHAMALKEYMNKYKKEK